MPAVATTNLYECLGYLLGALTCGAVPRICTNWWTLNFLLMGFPLSLQESIYLWGVAYD